MCVTNRKNRQRMAIGSFAILALLCPWVGAAGISSHLTHYGMWKSSDITTFQRYGLVALQPGHYEGSDGETQAIARLRANGTKVLLYLSIGEDASTYDQGKPAVGDGRGPVRWNAATASILYENKGIASYYLDEWNAKGYDPDSVNKVPDGLPDRQGDWGSCFVNAGDSAWQALMLTEAARLIARGADGFFLDTPETANPWTGYGWTSEGMYHLIRKMREAHAGKYLLLNRGLFFFDPDHELQYRWSPRKFLDGTLFESYVTGSNYPVDQGGNGLWRENPYFASNKYIVAPRLNAEMNRPDSRGAVFHIDYMANPLRAPLDLPDVFQRIRQEVVVEQGWVPQINDRMLSQAPALFLDNPAPSDRNPPAWRNTAAYMGQGGVPPPPRTGMLKAIPGNGTVTLRWDVASDQTWPVRYNLYFAKNGPIDFNTSAKILDVKTEIGADYTDRPGTGAEDGCPYEFTLTGLTNQALYRFAVRAEDATTGVDPALGRIGPGGGIEETNTQVVMAIPRDSTAFPMVIDGATTDWSGIPAIADSANDATSVDFVTLAASDDRDALYLNLQFAGVATTSQVAVLFNTDRRSTTGDIVPAASGFRGVDFKWENGALYRHQNWDWIRLTANATVKTAGNTLEMRIAKQDLGLVNAQGLDILATTIDKRDILPNQGLTGFSYSFTRPAVPAGLPKARSLRSRQVLSLSRGPNGLHLTFRNPQRKAEINVYDITGKALYHRENVQEETLVCAIGREWKNTVLVTLRAQGMHSVSRLWMVE